MSHEATIVAGPIVDLEAGFFRAECSCGWRGNNVSAREYAVDESMVHARSVGGSAVAPEGET